MIVPKPVSSDITSNSEIMTTKLASINVTNSISYVSSSILDGGIKFQATSISQEKNYTFYRSGSTAQLTTSMIALDDSHVNFTINNSPPADTMLNITGTQMTNLYLNGVSTNTWHYNNGVNVITIGAVRNVAIYYTNGASNLIDNNVLTEWKSTNEAHPYAYVDLGSAIIVSEAAIYPDKTNTNCTRINLQTSTDAINWNYKRTTNVSLWTNGAWNFERWDLDSKPERYVRLYCADNANRVLAIWEFKVLEPTSTSVLLSHGHLSISISDPLLPLNK